MKKENKRHGLEEEGRNVQRIVKGEGNEEHYLSTRPFKYWMEIDMNTRGLMIESRL